MGDTHTHIIYTINMSVLLCTIQHNVLCFYKLSRYFSTDICSKSFHHTILFLYSIEPINYFHSLINKTYGDSLCLLVPPVPVLMHLLEVRPPVPGLALDGDLEAGRHPLHLQPPQLVVRGARQDLLGAEPLPLPASFSLLD